MPRLLIIGGSDGGISAALCARELDPSWEVSVLVADAYPNFSICGLPYFLSGEVPDWRMLAHRSIDDLENAGIELLLDHAATEIDPAAGTVSVNDLTLRFDRLVVATGADPVRPRLPGIDHEGVYQLHTMGDSLLLDNALASNPQRAVIVGAGYIGLEMAEALRRRGLEVTVVEQLPMVLPTVDPELGQIVRDELARNGVHVLNGATVTAIEREQEEQLSVRGNPDLQIDTDIVLVVVGVRPNVELARGAGVAVTERGPIQVNRHMETSLPGIYAAGDCVATYHRLLDSDTYLPLGTTAHKQGRVAGENAVGGERQFEGSLGTQVVKIFELAAARTGVRDAEATAAGFDPLTVESNPDDHKRYYSGAHPIAIRTTGDRRSGRLLGMQLLGNLRSEVPKRVDIAAGAIHHGMTVDAVSDLDLSYTPPFGSPWDAVQIAAQAWSSAATTSADGLPGS
jgi:NADPH-dependent 2,4-dienoyl-CoA reductase/sulfur reductase-like enzyme